MRELAEAKVKNTHSAQTFCYTFTEQLIIDFGAGELTITQWWRDCSRSLHAVTAPTCETCADQCYAARKKAHFLMKTHCCFHYSSSFLHSSDRVVPSTESLVWQLVTSTAELSVFWLGLDSGLIKQSTRSLEPLDPLR